MVHILPHTERFIEAFNHLKSLNKLPSNLVIARKIGMKSANSLTEIRRGRQNIQIQHLQKFCEIYGIDFYALMSGAAPEQHTAPLVTVNDKNKAGQLIPYFENDLLSAKFDTPERLPVAPAYYMDIPEFSGCMAFRVYSDSMSPIIKPGGIMFCRRIKDWMDILEYGQIYAIRLKDDRKFLKYICKHPKADKFILKSANTEQDDFDVPKEKVDAVWLVEGWMNKKTQ